MPDKSIAVSFRAVSRHYGAVKAVDDVTLEIRRGETLGLVGESGCGKSPVGRAILRLYKPTDGKIFFDGQDISDLGDEELRPPTQAFVHRARYLGPKARLPSEELRGLGGLDLVLARSVQPEPGLEVVELPPTPAALVVPERQDDVHDVEGLALAERFYLEPALRPTSRRTWRAISESSPSPYPARSCSARSTP